jgi:hypothetical protein
VVTGEVEDAKVFMQRELPPMRSALDAAEGKGIERAVLEVWPLSIGHLTGGTFRGERWYQTSEWSVFFFLRRAPRCGGSQASRWDPGVTRGAFRFTGNCRLCSCGDLTTSLIGPSPLNPIDLVPHTSAAPVFQTYPGCESWMDRWSRVD